MNRICVLLLLVAFAGPAVAEDWPQFRGPGGVGVSRETDLPVTWSKTEGLRWKVALPGRGLSSPVVSGGRVYITACTGYQQRRLHVLCYDAATGKQLWDRQLAATGNTHCNDKTNMAAPTPVTDGEHIYALFATCDLVCYDKDGNLQWYRALTKDYPTITNQVGMAASPILYKDVLLVQLENVGESFAAGFDKRTGQNKWKIERTRDINWTTPLLYEHGGRAELLLQSPDQLSAHDPLTGKEYWKLDGGGSGIPSPTAGSGLVVVIAAETLALRPGDKKPEIVWRSAKLRSGTASALIHRNRIYAITGPGILACADIKDGKILWQERLTGPFSSSPIWADGKIYATNEAGKTFVVQAGDEPKLLAANEVDETILCTPAFADGAIFLRSDQHLYCIAKKKP